MLDMNNNQSNTLMHDQMVAAIDQNLNQNKKALIMVNRRGYSSFLKCRKCGTIQQCNACNTSYTYHSDGVFRCHRCLSPCIRNARSAEPSSRHCENRIRPALRPATGSGNRAKTTHRAFRPHTGDRLACMRAKGLPRETAGNSAVI